MKKNIKTRYFASLFLATALFPLTSHSMEEDVSVVSSSQGQSHYGHPVGSYEEFSCMVKETSDALRKLGQDTQNPELENFVQTIMGNWYGHYRDYEEKDFSFKKESSELEFITFSESFKKYAELLILNPELKKNLFSLIYNAPIAHHPNEFMAFAVIEMLSDILESWKTSQDMKIDEAFIQQIRKLYYTSEHEKRKVFLDYIIVDSSRGRQIIEAWKAGKNDYIRSDTERWTFSSKNVVRYMSNSLCNDKENCLSLSGRGYCDSISNSLSYYTLSFAFRKGSPLHSSSLCTHPWNELSFYYQWLVEKGMRFLVNHPHCNNESFKESNNIKKAALAFEKAFSEERIQMPPFVKADFFEPRAWLVLNETIHYNEPLTLKELFLKNLMLLDPRLKQLFAKTSLSPV